MLDGRTIVVTGAASGLGRAFAIGAAQTGAARVIVADRDRAGGEAVADEIIAQGACADFIEVDLAVPHSIEAFGKALASLPDGIDGLVNNAAIATGIGGKTYDEIDIETWDRVMSVNVRGTWLVIRALAPLIGRSAHGGRIVNIASDTAIWGAPRLLHYVASKGAIMSMTYALSRELGGLGVTVNAVAPGLILTPSTDYVPQDRKDLYVDQSALQRPGMPQDVVGAVTFLLSDAAGFVSGQVLPVNGGFTHA